MHPIPLTSIELPARQRTDYGNLSSLKESLREHGTIHPIVLESLDGGTFRLLAGGRRLKCLLELGFSEVFHGSACVPGKPGFVLASELPLEEREMVELEENTRRKDLTWQERVRSVARYHEIRVRKGALEGDLWTQAQTGELLGVERGHVSKVLAIANLLRDPKHPVQECDSLYSALQWYFRDQQEKAEARLRSYAPVTPAVNTPEETAAVSLVEKIKANVDLLRMERERYASNPLNTIPFDEYWAEKQKLAEEVNNRVVLSNKLIHCDCLDFGAANPNTFDHIVTDPPYGIPMEMLAQDNVGMVDIETVAEEHSVVGNTKLLTAFFPVAFAALKENGFCVTWADQMQWEYIYNVALAAGFKVQRWPLVWVKSSRCMNTAAQYNFTKATEIAVVCRKGNATLIEPASVNYIIASKDDLTEGLGHPFAKPFSVWEFILKYVSFESQLIWDPFAGCGSGVISALRMKRNIIACEKDEKHYNRLLENVRKHYLVGNPKANFV